MSRDEVSPGRVMCSHGREKININPWPDPVTFAACARYGLRRVARRTAVTSYDVQGLRPWGGESRDVGRHLSPFDRDRPRKSPSSAAAVVVVVSPPLFRCRLYTYVSRHSAKVPESFAYRTRTFVTRARPCCRVEIRLQFFAVEVSKAPRDHGDDFK